MSQSKNPNTVDRISDLPDEILCHILSFLPTEQAFTTTTLLSKRWNKLCYSLTTLCFDDQTTASYDRERFFRSIDTLMLSPRVENQFLKTFRFKYRFGINISEAKFKDWIKAATRRRIQELDLFIDNNFTLNHHPTFFISQTLVVLKLEMLLFQYKFFCADLPLLKTLHLKHVRFEYQNDIKKLLNACPNLQDLHIYYPLYRRSEKNIEAEEFKSLFLSKLVRADIRPNICSIDVPFNAIHNVEYLCVQVASFEIFKTTPVFQNLIHAKLWFGYFFHCWDGIVEFLRHCPKLQILYINKDWYCDTSLSKDWDFPILSPECVSSHLRSCTIVHFEGSKSDLRFATYILQNAKVLEVMKLKIYVTAGSSNKIQKRQIREELSTCPRMSLDCKLSFEFI